MIGELFLCQAVKLSGCGREYHLDYQTFHKSLWRIRSTGRLKEDIFDGDKCKNRLVAKVNMPADSLPETLNTRLGNG